jgi:signal transduction histidine kinase
VSLSKAQSPATVLTGKAKASVITNGLYYYDNACTLKFEDVSTSLFNKNFHSGPLDEVSIKENVNCYWIKFDLQNISDDNNEWLIDFGSWDHVELYAGDSNIGFQKKVNGALLPYLKRDFPIGGRNLINLTIKKGQSLSVFVKLTTGTDYMEKPANLACAVFTKSAVISNESAKMNTLFFFSGIYVVMFLYNFFVYFSIKERSYKYYLFLIFFALYALWQNTGYTVSLLKAFPSFPSLRTNFDLVASSIFGVSLLIFTRISLGTKVNTPITDKIFNGIMVALILVLIPALFGNSLLATNLSSLLGLITTTLIIIASVRSYRNKYPSAGIFLLANGMFMLCIFVYLLLAIMRYGSNLYVGYLLPLGSVIQIVLYSVALGNSINVLKKQNAESQHKIIEQLQLYGELQNRINKELEQKVEERTRELKESQQQLIQQEKLASLGELTAGVAHEIQNPLNFIKNFSELNTDLIKEMNDEINAGNFSQAQTLSADIKENIAKIVSHGNRLDSIVRGMLQLSRTDAGQRETTDINHMCDEFLNLSFHGLKAKDKSFSAYMEKHFDPAAGNVRVNKQSVGRVLLNLFNNAFYAVNEKQKINRKGYTPLVSVTTKRTDNLLEIIVRDNGNGISQKNADKIFQPFFTTKPTGSGTGLGLSISYEVIKEHNGNIKVNSEEGNFTEFIVTLPYNVLHVVFCYPALHFIRLLLRRTLQRSEQ